MMVRFSIFWSEQHRDWVKARAAHFGIPPVEYIRRLIDRDREQHENKKKHQTQP